MMTAKAFLRRYFFAVSCFNTNAVNGLRAYFFMPTNGEATDAYLPLVRQLAARHRGSGLKQDDLVQEGIACGFLPAVRKLDRTKLGPASIHPTTAGISFSTSSQLPMVDASTPKYSPTSSVGGCFAAKSKPARTELARRTAVGIGVPAAPFYAGLQR